MGNVAVRWRPVGRLKLSSARANSTTGLSNLKIDPPATSVREFERYASFDVE